MGPIILYGQVHRKQSHEQAKLSLSRGVFLTSNNLRLKQFSLQAGETATL